MGDFFTDHERVIGGDLRSLSEKRYTRNLITVTFASAYADVEVKHELDKEVTGWEMIHSDTEPIHITEGSATSNPKETINLQSDIPAIVKIRFI